MHLAGNGGPNPTSPLHLKLERIRDNSWRTYIIKNHPMHTAPAGCKICWGVYFAGSLRGVIVWGRPVSSNEDQEFTLEESRFYLDDTCPTNSESRVLSIAVRLVHREYPHIRRLIAYCDTASGFTGTYLKACGWTCLGLRPKHDGWTHRPGRTSALPGHRTKWEFRYDRHIPGKRHHWKLESRQPTAL